MSTIAEKLQSPIDGTFRIKYREAIDYLDDNYAYFLTHVLNMGVPEWRSDIQTAAVSPANGVSVGKGNKTIKGNFRYLFNPKFAEALSVEEVAFIQAHETMHILLEHLSLMDKFSDKRLFNIAADCCINDYLANMGLTVPEEVMRGEDNVGYDATNSTVAQVYSDLEQKVSEANAQGDEHSAVGEHWDDHSWMEGLTDEERKAMGQIAKGGSGNGELPQDIKDQKAADQGKDAASCMPPGTGYGPSAGFTEQHGVTMKWAELLRQINPDVFKPHGPPPRPSYHKPRRKMMGFYPNLMLPVEREVNKNGKGECPAIVMALDTSGSIGHDDANRFVNLAKSIPQNKIKLFVCTFTTRYKELDLENPVWDSGGTCFSCIEDFIQDKAVPKLKHYPKSVVVITDGHASFRSSAPKSEHNDRWHWLITSGGSGNSGFGTNYNLNDFANGS